MCKRACKMAVKFISKTVKGDLTPTILQNQSLELVPIVHLCCDWWI